MGHRTRFLNLPYTDEAPINLAFDKIDAAVEGIIASGGGGGGAPGTFSSATHDFTPAELFALDVTPVEMISSPGDGFAILPIKVVIRTIGGTVAYDDGALHFYYGTNAGANFISGSFSYPILSDDLLDSINAPTQVGQPITDFEDLAVIVQNDTSAPAVGDGTMSVTILYTVVPV